ncbi:adenylate/guanylate cyclase domain-containing protein [Tsukamurella soli]|uniref:Adenylate/guanylate cyclase domain-containing protein n=1 Tax=Tsukamurella soli TaxID=644556 RepID=A0ABP8J298_9ACTN
MAGGVDDRDDRADRLRSLGVWAGSGVDEDQVALYRFLLDAGMPIDKLRAVIAGGDPQVALAEHRLLGDGRRYDLDAVAARAGLAPAGVVEVLRALGLAVPAAGEETLSTADLRAVEVFAEVSGFFGEETMLRFGRVVRSAVGRIADAAVAMFGISVEDPLRQRGGTGAEVTEAADRALGSLGLVPELFAALFARQALDAVRRASIAHGADSSHETITVTVGFGDLVGSTAWVRTRTPRELAVALGEFERVAQASLAGQARLVKTIGDEVMFVALTPDEACHTALNLIAELRSAHLPELRVGLAHGRVVALDGDLYGPVVNLAARLVHQAQPGQILADPALAAAADGTGLSFTALAPRRLAGFDEPVVPHAVEARR